MPSGHHNRRRSPSPYSESSSSSGSGTEGHRSRRSHKRRPHKSSKNPPGDVVTTPKYYSGGYDQRSKPSDRRPELRRSYSDDTYRHISGNDRDRGHDRGRDQRVRKHSSDDGNYYDDRYGHPHRRSSSSSRSRSRPRSRGRRSDDKHHSTFDSLKPIVEDVLAAFGLISAKHAKDNHRDRGHLPSGRDRDHYDRDRNYHKSSKVSRSASRGGSRGDRKSHHDYLDTMVEPGRSPSHQTAALRAAVTAAALEAFRTRKEFGGITPERLLRIAGAAVAAGGLDAIVQRDRHHKDGGTRDVIESVIGGMKSSSAFGHRIRRRHDLSSKDQMKYQLMQAATAKVLDRHFGMKDKSLLSKSPRSRSSTGLRSLMKSMAVQ